MTGLINFVLAPKELNGGLFIVLCSLVLDLFVIVLWERLLLTNGMERAGFVSKTPEYVETIIFLDYIKMYS